MPAATVVFLKVESETQKNKFHLCRDLSAKLVFKLRSSLFSPLSSVWCAFLKDDVVNIIIFMTEI